MTSSDAIRSRIQSSQRKTRSKAWVGVKAADITPGVVVTSYDQSLGNTGWVRLVVHNNGWAEVLERGTLRTRATDEKGHAGSLRRAVELHGLLESQRIPDPGQVLYEAPAARGYRVESSLLAALAVRLVHPEAVSVQRQHAAALFLPRDQRTEKKYTTSVVARFTGSSDRWNEHERDAFLLALTYLHDLGR